MTSSRVAPAAAHTQTLHDLMREGREVIVERWLEAVRTDRRVETSDVAEPILEDSVPDLLGEILKIMVDPDAELRSDAVFHAKRHGENRADNSFAIDELVREYQLLREELFRFVQERLGAFDSISRSDLVTLCRRLGRALDEALRVTTQAFLERYTDELERLSRTDSLTGLLDHGTFFERLGEELERARRHHLELTVVLLDLDDFKGVNEDRGHLAGDRLLRLTGETLEESLRASDIVCRYGGDEFAVVLPETGNGQVEDLFDRVSEAVATLVRTESLSDGFGFSHGTASFPTDGAEGEELVARADERLRRAKREKVARGLLVDRRLASRAS